MTGRLDGKRIIVTGAAGGIGAAVVHSFIAEGARVVIADTNFHGAERVAAEAGQVCRALRCDVSNEEIVRTVIGEATGWLGGLDVLVNNAAVMKSGMVTDFAVEDWDRIMGVNVRAHFLTSKHAVPHLRKAGGGSIINTSSVAGQRGGPGSTAYSTSKGAVIALTTTLALELAGDNIRVNAVCPGWVDTPFNDPIIDFIGGKQAHAELVKSMVPMGRQGTPEDIAPFYVYLASDESSYMTAKTVGIDGGAYN